MVEVHDHVQLSSGTEEADRRGLVITEYIWKDGEEACVRYEAYFFRETQQLAELASWS